MRRNIRLSPDELLIGRCLKVYEDKALAQCEPEGWEKDVLGAIALMVLGTICLVLAFA